MAILAFDTSTKVLSIALAQKEKILVQYRLNVNYTHSEYLLPLIDDALNIASINKDEIEVIGLVIGPGSFTGLRIGLAVAKGLNLSLGSRLLTYTSLEAIAANQLGSREKVLSILPAQRNEIYGGLFNVTQQKPQLIEDYFLGRPEEVLQKYKEVGQIRVVGEGYNKFSSDISTIFGDNLIEMPSYSHLTDSSGLIAMINYDINNNRESANVLDIRPFYMRLSSAEEKRINKDS
ncbi:MAG: tRNA (adenosine(37)-N6)-threonylcarbamoyltransferase complex dimerization subunit type 1 TsaB [Clostridia bacterium]